MGGHQAAWVGWHRESKRSPWRAVVEAESYSAAWDKLLCRPGNGDKVVMRRGSRPETPHHQRRAESGDHHGR